MGSLEYILGPGIAFLALLLIGVFMRWAFGTGYGRQTTPAPADEGLLTLVATRVSRPSSCGVGRRRRMPPVELPPNAQRMNSASSTMTTIATTGPTM